MDKSTLLAQAKKVSKSPVGFFVENQHMAVLALIAITLGGYMGLQGMPVESAPEVKIPVGTVTTIYPGASPSDVEKLVTDEIEDELQSLDDVRKITSNSQEGVSVIIVEFEADADLTESIRNLRDEVSIASSLLPDDAEEPVVKQIRADDEPIIVFALTGKGTLNEFDTHSEALKDMIEAISGIDEVSITGVPEREMQVLVKRNALDGYNLSLREVVRKISQNHITFPIGTVETDSLAYQVSLKAEFNTSDELQDLVIGSSGNSNIYLRDIAEVREVFAEATNEGRLWIKQDDAKEQSILLSVQKKVGADLVTIVEEAKKRVKNYQETTLPSYFDVVVTDDFSELIRDDIYRLAKSAIQTIIIIGITLFFALGVREALVASLSLPILYLMSLFLLWYVGETFNFLTFFALILSLGVVIDTSIVVIEGVYDNMRHKGLEVKEAALASVATFRGPLTSGTLTTVSAFVPLGLMSGIMGEYVKHIPITVNITLLSSLITALMILPVIAIWVLSREKKTDRKPPLLERSIGPWKTWFIDYVRTVLHTPRRQKLWVRSMFVALIVAISLPVIGVTKVQMFGAANLDFMIVNFKGPEGLSLSETANRLEQLEEIIEELPEVENYSSLIGSGGPHEVRLRVELTPKNNRSISSSEIQEILRSKAKSITNAEVTVMEGENGPPSGSPIELRVLGEDMNTLELAAYDIEQELKKIDGAIDIRNDLSASPGEFHLSVKRDRIEAFGLSALDIADEVRTSVYGNDSVKIIRAGEETPIVVRLDERSQICKSDPVMSLIEAKENRTLCTLLPESISTIENILVSTPSGKVPLSELTEVRLVPAVTTIRHFDQERVITITGNVSEGTLAQDVITELQKALSTIELPENVRVDFGGESEELQESFNSLGRATLVGIILIASILVYQFKSFRQTLIILFTIPLALIGVIGGLTILGLPLSFPGFIGLAALAGIVVNDAIVLIDKINSNRFIVGMELEEAVLDGTEQRLEPVLITTATTALGMLPLVASGDVFRDLAIVVAIGITFATVLTLLMVPIFYMRLESPKEGTFWSRRKKQLQELITRVQRLRS